jgi:DNA-binding response OmpR family regulator
MDFWLDKEIRKIRSGTPIVIRTGDSKQIDKEKYRQIGINALVIKPMTKSALAKTARKALDEPNDRATNNLIILYYIFSVQYMLGKQNRTNI